MPSQRNNKFFYDAISLETGGSTGGLKMEPYVSVSFQFLFDFDGGDATGNVQLDASNDGVNWSMYPDATLAFTNALTPANHILEVRNFRSEWIRATVVNATGNGGTTDIIAYVTTVPE
jgi:hypothetical protein